MKLFQKEFLGITSKYLRSLQKKFGAFNHLPIPDLCHAIQSHGVNSESVIRSSVTEDGSLLVVILTPLMVRVHQHHPQSGQLMFVCTSGGTDKYNNTHVFHLMTSSSLGGLPLGCLLTTSGEESVIAVGLGLFLDILPDGAFYGRGQRGPSVIMTDGSPAEKEALQKVFPEATQYLYFFHVLRVMWKHLWSWDKGNQVAKEHRDLLYTLMKDIFSSTSEEILNDYLSRCFTHTIVDKVRNAGSVDGDKVTQEARRKGSTDSSDSVKSLGEDVYTVSRDSYTVNSLLGFCSCVHGLDDEVCGHQFAVSIEVRSRSWWNLPGLDESERLGFYKLATGLDNLPEDWTGPWLSDKSNTATTTSTTSTTTTTTTNNSIPVDNSPEVFSAPVCDRGNIVLPSTPGESNEDDDDFGSCFPDTETPNQSSTSTQDENSDLLVRALDKLDIFFRDLKQRLLSQPELAPAILAFADRGRRLLSLDSSVLEAAFNDFGSARKRTAKGSRTGPRSKRKCP